MRKFKLFRMFFYVAVVLFVGNCCGSLAYGYDFEQVSQITAIEPTYMPKVITFTVQEPQSGCYWYAWYPHGDTEAEKENNINALYATLLTAQSTNKSVRLYVTVDNNGSSPLCIVDYIHMLN